ncbi:MAG: hypothetical protein Ct9H300mP8_00810 [Gammaproteobacteria bacterium]|nr:MAG: hypothetical protein Ct9H300mP8_00810 [Gammaproteobacteria bacterium]
MADNVGTPPKIAFGSGSDVSLINVVFATFLHVLRNSIVKLPSMWVSALKYGISLSGKPGC